VRPAQRTQRRRVDSKSAFCVAMFALDAALRALERSLEAIL
jgi:hypothetical protein